MKAGLIAPAYLSVSWVLTVSYQLFTDTAVKTLATYIGFWWPNAGVWINSNIETLVFIYAFTWIFVLSSVIPSVILGKERGVLKQYSLVLTLSMIAFFMPDILQTSGGIQINQIFGASAILQNPILAGVYLALPYLFMVGLDIRAKRALRGTKQLNKIVDKLNRTPVPKYSFVNQGEDTFLVEE